MGELDGNENMQREFEKMMQELIAAGQAGSDKEAMDHIGKATEAVTHPSESGAGEKKSGGKKEESFQDTIRKTMERMQASGDSASAAAASGAGGGSEEDLIAQMMKELQAGGGAEGGGEEDFNKMLMGMMAQLTNKEILYEPMKELHDKFPAWMEKNEGRAGTEDLLRYKHQQELVGEIVGRFERKGYSDDDETDREFIVERMQKVRLADTRLDVFPLTPMLDASRRIASARSGWRYERSSGSVGRSRRWMSDAMTDAKAVVHSVFCDTLANDHSKPKLQRYTGVFRVKCL